VGGEVISHVAGSATAAETRPTLRFAQVSDSHIGFTGPANADVTGSFTRAVDQINGLGYTPDVLSGFRLRRPDLGCDGSCDLRTLVASRYRGADRSRRTMLICDCVTP
jgi:hypothetical protein